MSVNSSGVAEGILPRPGGSSYAQGGLAQYQMLTGISQEGTISPRGSKLTVSYMQSCQTPWFTEGHSAACGLTMLRAPDCLHLNLTHSPSHSEASLHQTAMTPPTPPRNVEGCGAGGTGALGKAATEAAISSVLSPYRSSLRSGTASHHPSLSPDVWQLRR